MRLQFVCLWTVALAACGTPASLPVVTGTTADAVTVDVALADASAAADSAAQAAASPDAAETVPAVDALADLTAPADVSATADASADVTPADAAQDAAVACSPDCPKVVISGVSGGPFVPQTIVKPSCADSVPTCGAKLAKCLWTVKTPNGDKKVEALPGVLPPFAADQSGEYKLCLQVLDSAGKWSCNDVCLSFLVIPNNALHIELTWFTPGDPDPLDSGPAAGADLDLHFAHTLALIADKDCDGVQDPWFHNPFDAFWYNNKPTWGAKFNPDDDPSVDLDDTDGAGPENLNLAAPEGSIAEPMAYSVGVHYWNDHAYGASTAKVYVYVQGGLAYQVAQTLNVCDMWYVGKVNWPNTATGGPLPVFKPCFQTGQSCPAGKNLMWAPAGDGCVTPKYGVPKVFPGLGGC